MQDGQNLFFPQEAFMGREWQVDETSRTLAAMCAVEDAVFIGIYSEDRMRDYTRPGDEPYGRSLAEEIVPEAKRRLRIGPTAAIASSGARRLAEWFRSIPSGNTRMSSALASACRARSHTRTT